MTITTSHQLTTQELSDLKGLAESCKKVDGSVPNLYFYILEQPRTLPASTFYYEKGKLIGFLSIYFFYENAVEVALLVHPDYRRRSIAKKLLQESRLLVEIHQIKTLIFTNPTARNTSWLEGQGFRYQHSEYHMVRNDLNPLLDYKQDLSFRDARSQDISELCALDVACFTRKQPELPERFQNLLNDRAYKVIIVELEGVVIGKAHIRWEAYGASLSDISILPRYQGKGYGSALISHCVNLILSEGKQHISLDVETHNTRALELYQKLGFFTDNACDYWSIPLDTLVSANKLA